MKERTKIKVFRIDNPLECSIIERLNRFVVMVEIKGTNHPAYINNTGRLSKFLVKGRKAFCFRTQNQGKTDFFKAVLHRSHFKFLVSAVIASFTCQKPPNQRILLCACRARRGKALSGPPSERPRLSQVPRRTSRQIR